MLGTVNVGRASNLPEPPSDDGTSSSILRCMPLAVKEVLRVCHKGATASLIPLIDLVMPFGVVLESIIILAFV